MNNKRITSKRTLRIGLFTTILLMASLATALHGCTDESEAAAGEASDTEELRITVTDSSYRPADAPRSSEADYAARTTEEGYQTTFTEGDKIGFYSVKDDELVKENVCLTMKNGVWKLPEGVKLLKNEADYFFVYFPYKESPGIVFPNQTDSDNFFGTLRLGWTPNTDQSSQANYSAQDLMLGTGTLEGRDLTVTLKHRMALVVIGLPAGVSAQTFSGFKPFQVGNEYRYLIPAGKKTKIEGTYTNGTGTHEYTFNANIPAGTYKRFGFAPVSMSFKIDLAGQTDKTFTLPFKRSGTISGYFLKVDWGDGTVSKIAEGTDLYRTITHDYGASAKDEYTITIYSSQGDYSKEQIPGFKPGDESSSYWINGRFKLKQLLTPLLNTGETDFEDCFSTCIRLTGEIPAGLFANNKQATNFCTCFYQCTGLTGSIPPGLFANNTQVTDFSQCFTDCRGLTGEIPAGLFANNKQATNFRACFFNCVRLTLNKNIFCDEDTERYTRFAGQSVEFTNCFTWVGSDSSVSANAGTAPALWDYAGTFEKAACYTGIGTVTNKDDIPAEWWKD